MAGDGWALLFTVAVAGIAGLVCCGVCGSPLAFFSFLVLHIFNFNELCYVGSGNLEEGGFDLFMKASDIA